MILQEDGGGPGGGRRSRRRSRRRKEVQKEVQKEGGGPEGYFQLVRFSDG